MYGQGDFTCTATWYVWISLEAFLALATVAKLYCHVPARTCDVDARTAVTTACVCSPVLRGRRCWAGHVEDSPPHLHLVLTYIEKIIQNVVSKSHLPTVGSNISHPQRLVTGVLTVQHVCYSQVSFVH